MSSISLDYKNDVPYSAVLGAYSPNEVPEYGPQVARTANHAVLYQLPWETRDQRPGPPFPYPGKDKWDDNHVRMPYSKENTYSVAVPKKIMNFTAQTEYKPEPRWNIITKALQKKMNNSHELAKRILKYNQKFEGTWKFLALHKFFNEYISPQESRAFFDHTLPKIAELALSLPDLIHGPIPLLKQKKTMSVSLSQWQIASLLANAFFCTFPWRNTTSAGTAYSKYPKINFISLYESVDVEGTMEKLRCLCHYFKRVCNEPPTGVVTFTRRYVPKHECPDWGTSTAPMDSLPVHVNAGTPIEDAEGMVQVDFANKFLGGGVLGRGLVQEEIRFLICPELIASMLFTECLEPTEALLVLGCERYSDYTGYGRRGFRWTGDYRDRTRWDGFMRRRTAILAIDAINYHNQQEQFQQNKIVRELNKAWVGFSMHAERSKRLNFPGVATGNWGCGAFKGAPQLKSLIQMMACAHARRPMLYCCFNDAKVQTEVSFAYQMLRKYKVTVGQLYSYLIQYETTDQSVDLHRYLRSCLDPHKYPPIVRNPGKNANNRPKSYHTPEGSADYELPGQSSHPGASNPNYLPSPFPGAITNPSLNQRGPSNSSYHHQNGPGPWKKNDIVPNNAGPSRSNDSKENSGFPPLPRPKHDTHVSANRRPSHHADLDQTPGREIGYVSTVAASDRVEISGPDKKGMPPGQVACNVQQLQGGPHFVAFQSLYGTTNQQEDEGQRNEDKWNERQRNEGQRNEGQENEDKWNERQRKDGERNEGQRNEGQRNEGQRNEGQRNEGQRNEGQRNESHRNEGQRIMAYSSSAWQGANHCSVQGGMSANQFRAATQAVSLNDSVITSDEDESPDLIIFDSDYENVSKPPTPRDSKDTIRETTL